MLCLSNSPRTEPMSQSPLILEESTAPASLHFRRGDRDFERVYIACENCRKKKTRCDLGGNGQDLFAFTGPPCAHCRRERRECIFSEQRNSSKRRKTNACAKRHSEGSRFGRRSRGQELLPAQCDGSDKSTPAQESHYEIHPSAGQADQISMASSLQSQSHDVQVNHSDTVLRTTLSKGNDPINLLFEVVPESEHEKVNSQYLEEPLSHPSVAELGNTYNSEAELHPPTPTFAKISVNAKTLSLWNSSQFARRGLFSAEQAIIYLRLCVVVQPGCFLLLTRPQILQ